MHYHKINIRLRLVIIKNGKLLTSYTKKHDFYFYVGGHLEKGETILEGCKREIKEECGNDAKFDLEKVLYVTDFFDDRNNEQNVELFILGKLNKFKELEGRIDTQHEDGSMWLTWLEINNLPENLYPKILTKKIVKAYKDGFPNAGEYIERPD